MSSFLMVRVEVNGLTALDLNERLKASPQDGVNQIINLLAGATAGNKSALIDVAVRETTQSISADGAGSTASYNLK